MLYLLTSHCICEADVSFLAIVCLTYTLSSNMLEREFCQHINVGCLLVSANGD